MNKKGWVVGLLGTVVVCALAASAARAAPEASRDARESGAGARPLVAAEEAPGLEGRVPAVAKEDLGGPAEATGGAKGGDPLREATGGQRGASVAAENAATVPDEPRRVREIPEQAAEELPEGSSVESISADESVLLNFERGDIREVIHSLATALGLSYMIDPRVEGQVTIRTIGRISKEHLFPVFNRILRNNGIAAVKVDSVYHIIPVGEAKTRAILPPTAATRAQLEATDSFIIEIIPVSHVAAEDMVGVLEPFVTPGGDVFAYPRGNLLIVTDLMTNVERLRDLAASLDTDAFKGMRTRVYKIEHGDLELITEELAALLSSYGHNVDGSTGLSLIPMPRLESLTCISYDQAAFRQIEQWLQVLDVEPEEGAGRIIQVYHVENTKAADLASILNELFGDGGGGGRSRARGRPFGQARSAFGRTGTSSRRGGRRGSAAQPLTRPRRGRATSARQTSGNLHAMTAQQRSGNQPGSLATGQRVTTAQQSSKKQPASRARGQRARVGGRRGQPARGGRGRRGPAAGSVGVVLPGGREAGGRGFGGVPGPPPIFKEEVRIVADETTNSLIVLAVKPDYEKVLEVLRKIDVVPRQVVIEVVIAEITLDKSLEFGVDHAIKAGNLLGEAPAGDKLDSWIYSSRPSGVGALPEGAKDPLRRSILALKDPGGGGLAAYIVKPGKFAAILKALADRSLVKILSAPHVIAADNQEAHIQVGESIPVLTSSSQSTLANANVVNQVQYRDVGTILTILPQVNSAGLVNMQVSQEVSKVSERQIEGIESPAFLTREAETTLVVQNGDSILIGGIIEEQKDTIRSGIPFIMDIPVLGRLFRFEKAAVKRTELLVLITPHVIRNRDEALSVTDEFTRVIRGLDRLLERRRGSSRFPGDEESFQSKGADRL